jgi:acyl-coenzyme A thioesterase PaaI-like protein
MNEATAREPEDSKSRDARALADALRTLGAMLSEREVPEPQLRAAASEIGAIQARWERFPSRLRWYETDADPATRRASSHAYHDEFGPLRGRANPFAPPLDVTSFVDDDEVVTVTARARLGTPFEGPPHTVHGGWLAACFDEVLAVVQRDAEVGGLTAELTVRYRRAAPIGEDLEFRGWIHEDLGRSVIARATCHARGDLVAEAEARFVRGADRLSARPRPE